MMFSEFENESQIRLKKIEEIELYDIDRDSGPREGRVEDVGEEQPAAGLNLVLILVAIYASIFLVALASHIFILLSLESSTNGHRIVQLLQQPCPKSPINSILWTTSPGTPMLTC
jgi:hypothetical protein